MAHATVLLMISGFSFFNWTSRSWAAASVLALHVVFALLLLQARGVLSVNPEPIKVSFVPTADKPVVPERPSLPVELDLPKPMMAPAPEVRVEREPSAMVAAVMGAETASSNAQPVVSTSSPVVISEVEYLREPALRYPAASRRLREQGTVVLRVLVDESGRAAQIDIQQSSGFPRLDEAACHAVRGAQFKPYVYEGRKQAALVMVPVEFSLRV